MKIFINLLFLFLVAGIFYWGFDVKSGLEEKKFEKELYILNEIKKDMAEMVPDSVKQIERDASHTLMYAESDGEDYWNARAASSAVSDYLKQKYPSYKKLDSMISAKQKEVGIKSE